MRLPGCTFGAEGSLSNNPLVPLRLVAILYTLGLPIVFRLRYALSESGHLSHRMPSPPDPELAAATLPQAFLQEKGTNGRDTIAIAPSNSAYPALAVFWDSGHAVRLADVDVRHRLVGNSVVRMCHANENEQFDLEAIRGESTTFYTINYHSGQLGHRRARTASTPNVRPAAVSSTTRQPIMIAKSLLSSMTERPLKRK